MLMQELLRPIPAALASCTRYYEALSAMRDTVSDMLKMRVGCHTLSAKAPWTPRPADLDCGTPQGRETVIQEESRSDDVVIRSRIYLSKLQQSTEGEEWGTASESSPLADNARRMSWPASPVTPTGP
jgi:HAUS augmin-like complex subunit 2